MAASAEYSLQTQAKIPCAIAVLHNFIWTHNAGDDANEDYDFTDSSDGTGMSPTHLVIPDQLGTHILPAEREHAGQQCDQIADDMWEDYQCELQSCGE